MEALTLWQTFWQMAVEWLLANGFGAQNLVQDVTWREMCTTSATARWTS